MSDRGMRPRDPLIILLALAMTFAIQRTILHHSPPDTHVYVRGYLVHHLFSGALLETAAAFVLACGIGSSWARTVARLALGVGSAMVLDEVIYLICTDGSGEAYRGPVSLWGAVVLESLAAAFLLALHRMARKPAAPVVARA